MKKKQVKISLTTDQLEALKALAKASNIDNSAYLQVLVCPWLNNLDMGLDKAIIEEYNFKHRRKK